MLIYTSHIRQVKNAPKLTPIIELGDQNFERSLMDYDSVTYLRDKDAIEQARLLRVAKIAEQVAPMVAQMKDTAHSAAASLIDYDDLVFVRSGRFARQSETEQRIKGRRKIEQTSIGIQTFGHLDGDDKQVVELQVDHFYDSARIVHNGMTTFVAVRNGMIFLPVDSQLRSIDTLTHDQRQQLTSYTSEMTSSTIWLAAVHDYATLDRLVHNNHRQNYHSWRHIRDHALWAQSISSYKNSLAEAKNIAGV